MNLGAEATNLLLSAKILSHLSLKTWSYKNAEPINLNKHLISSSYTNKVYMTCFHVLFVGILKNIYYGRVHIYLKKLTGSSIFKFSEKDTGICTAQKMKFSMKDFFSKCDQIHSFLRIWPHLLKKTLMEDFIFWWVFLVFWWNFVRQMFSRWPMSNKADTYIVNF